MRVKRWIIFASALLFVFVIGFAITRTTSFQKWYNPPTFYLPQDEDVVEMRASLHVFLGVDPAIPEFTVPAEHVHIILDWLRPAEYNRKPWPLDRLDELGKIVILTKSGEEIQLRFFDTGVNPVMFTSDGIDQFYGKSETYKIKINANGDEIDKGIDGGFKLYHAIRKASEAAKR